MSTGAGELKHRIRFEQRAADGNGDRLGAWVEEFTSRAKVTYLRGGEAVMAQRLQGQQPMVIRVRASAKTRTITTDWRAVNIATGAELGIISAAPDESGDWVDVMATTNGVGA